MQFTTWTAGAGFAHHPKVIFQPPNVGGRIESGRFKIEHQMSDFLSNSAGSIFGFVYCGIKPFRREIPFFNQQLPSPFYCILFEVIPERPISQHFKVGVVISVKTHIFKIVMLSTCPNAFVSIGAFCKGCLLNSQKKTERIGSCPHS